MIEKFPSVKVPKVEQSDNNDIEKEEALSDLVASLDGCNYFHANEVISSNSFSEIEIKEVVKASLVKHLSQKEIFAAEKLLKHFPLPNEMVQEAVKSRFIECVNMWKIGDATDLLRYYQLTNETLSDPEIQEAAKIGVNRALLHGQISYTTALLKHFPQANEVLHEAVKAGLTRWCEKGSGMSPALVKEVLDFHPLSGEEIQEATKAALLALLSKGSFYHIKKHIENFSLPDEFISGPEVQEATKAGLINNLSRGQISSNDELVLPFPVPDEMMQEAAESGLVALLSEGDVENIDAILKEFPNIHEFLSSPEVHEAAKTGLIKKLFEGHIDYATYILEHYLVHTKITANPEVQEAVKSGLITALSKGSPSVYRLLEHFQLPDEFLSGPEVQGAAKKGFIDNLNNYQFEWALEIKETFIPDLSVGEVISFLPKMEPFLETLNEEYPEIFSRLTESVDVFVALYQFSKEPEKFFNTLRDNTFLFDAITANPRFAQRLILKMSEFDSTALEALNKLHQGPQAKQTLDLFDTNYRTEMINHLREYKNNQEILKEMDSIGIDTETWLNYNKEQKFVLDETNKLPLAARTIETPLNRLVVETVAKLVGTFKEGFNKNIPEDMLLDKELDEKYRNLSDRLAKAKEALVGSVEDEKRVGIQKGIVALEKNLSDYVSPKMKDALNGMFGSLTVSADTIAKLMTSLDELQKSDGNNTREAVAQLKKLDKDIVDKTTVLMRRLDSALESIKAAGEKIKVSYDIFDTRELLEHLTEDQDSIRTILKEATLSEDSNQLVGREITIGVCNRNPSSSLYLGNYTGCCVSIEGTIHGKESPILDYLTDLGVQLVVASDTTNPHKPLPVAVAWTYIGQTEPDLTVLQIDNIEANTGYTDRHIDQFTEEMRTYMEDYAKALRIPLFQGSGNNDLKVVEHYGNSDKLGNLYNREGGYYLEAEYDQYEDEYEDEDD